MSNNIYVINGANLNKIPRRNPEFYGYKSLDEINIEISNKAASHGYECVFLQSNHEGDIIDLIQEAEVKGAGIIINAGAFSHYSYAIRDAIEDIGIPCVEVHFSNIYEREDFRKISVISDVCTKTIAGKKDQGYLEALDFIIDSYK